jgi:uncharacterized repeat protein (TIGR02543 family)
VASYLKVNSTLWGALALVVICAACTPIEGDIETVKEKAGVSKSYTVIFNSNGGSEVAKQTVNAGGTATRPANPARSGYTFDNWYSDAKLTAVYDFSTPVKGNITLYAKWNKVITYTVTFDSNGGSNVAAQTVESGETATHPANPTQSGYTFDNWYSDADLTAVYDFSTRVTGNITLYAQWNPVPPGSFTVTFNNGGGNNIPDQVVIADDRATEPEDLTFTGHAFGGWFKESSFTNQWNFASDTVTANTTLYAKWSQNTAGIFLDVKQIIDGAPIIADITISRTNNGYPVTFPVSVNISDYDAGSITWQVAGVGVYTGQSVTGTGGSFTLDAGDVKYNSLGGHVLILTVAKGGQQYQRAIPFTIVR